MLTKAYDHFTLILYLNAYVQHVVNSWNHKLLAADRKSNIWLLQIAIAG